jgi:hypothetical protein
MAKTRVRHVLVGSLGESATGIGIPETFAASVEENLLGGHVVTVKNGNENASFLFGTFVRIRP